MGRGAATGNSSNPIGVATDVAGNVFVCEAGSTHRVQKFVNPPAIALVSDAGSDQGKQVQLRVLRGSADSPGAGITITGYEVYRRNDALPGVATQSAEPMAIQLAGWTYVTSFAAHGDADYNPVVPDSGQRERVEPLLHGVQWCAR